MNRHAKPSETASSIILLKSITPALHPRFLLDDHSKDYDVHHRGGQKVLVPRNFHQFDHEHKLIIAAKPEQSFPDFVAKLAAEIHVTLIEGSAHPMARLEQGSQKAIDSILEALTGPVRQLTPEEVMRRNQKLAESGFTHVTPDYGFEVSQPHKAGACVNYLRGIFAAALHGANGNPEVALQKDRFYLPTFSDFAHSHLIGTPDSSISKRLLGIEAAVHRARASSVVGFKDALRRHQEEQERPFLGNANFPRLGKTG